jgi:hypothetical protein
MAVTERGPVDRDYDLFEMFPDGMACFRTRTG